MIKEAIEKILSLAPPNIIIGADGVARTDKPLTTIVPLIADPVRVQTLLGFTQLVSEKIDGFDPKTALIHVQHSGSVVLLASSADNFGRRKVFVNAFCEEGPKFQFGNFMASEQFLIALQTLFVPGAGDIDYILRMTSALAAEAVSTADDDGISQRVAVRSGAVLKTQEVVKPRIKLAPYRTFREVEQPVSEYVFRLRSREGDLPTCALFEADGGKWKLDAIQNIATWLSRNTTDIPVIA
jgi:hypothetical protein